MGWHYKDCITKRDVINIKTEEIPWDSSAENMCEEMNWSLGNYGAKCVRYPLNAAGVIIEKG